MTARFRFGITSQVIFLSSQGHEKDNAIRSGADSLQPQRLAFHSAICSLDALSLTDFVRCGFARSFSNRAISPAYDSFFRFFSTVSKDRTFRLPCASFRAPPANKMQRFPAETAHVGQRTEYICLRVSRWVFISLRFS